ncbi:MAG: 3-oxoacyl-[acyl-carrier-protein] reductase [Cytophagales bacterium]|nr:3-oxoacyl-[acyl-carrier-protein] reductase [Cytophagales bacterium]
MNLLEGKIAVITGASRGIGNSIAREFVSQGADVAFTFLSSVEKGKALEEELAASGRKVKGYQSDASDFEAAQQLIKDVLADFGRIDILINNAGVTRDNLLMRMDEQQWDDVLRINLKSVFNLTKAVTRPMLKERKGSIINITSVVGLMGNAGQANYAASKSGILGFTKSIAKELGSRNVRCNAIAPGFIETEMTDELDEEQLKAWLSNIPLKRAGKGKDIADACIFLASDMSSYVTGQTISVDGGMVM